MKTTIHGVKAICTSLIAGVVVLFLLLSVTPVYAAETQGGSQDISITVDKQFDDQYRYACDVVFYNMRFRYLLQSIAHNSETDETYVNNGAWILDDNLMDDVPLTVVNHADTPIAVTAVINDGPFVACDTTVNRSEGLQKEVLRECQLQGDSAYVSESSVQITLLGYPNVYCYKGEKILNVVVYVEPTSGYTTSGQRFESYM